MISSIPPETINVTSVSKKHYDDTILYRTCFPTLMSKVFTFPSVPTTICQDTAQYLQTGLTTCFSFLPSLQLIPTNDTTQPTDKKEFVTKPRIVQQCTPVSRLQGLLHQVPHNHLAKLSSLLLTHFPRGHSFISEKKKKELHHSEVQ
jgi:hypothetical protein